LHGFKNAEEREAAGEEKEKEE
jgi:hypothetical protein